MIINYDCKLQMQTFIVQATVQSYKTLFSIFGNKHCRIGPLSPKPTVFCQGGAYQSEASLIASNMEITEIEVLSDGYLRKTTLMFYYKSNRDSKMNF